MRLLLLLTHLVLATQGQDLIRACYYTNWSQYRTEPATFVPENIRPALCSHFFYAFVGMEGNQLAPIEWNDEDDINGNPGMYTRFNAHIQAFNPGAKTLLTVGGWNFDIEKMTSMLSTFENRQEFVASSIAFLRQRNFMGLDLNFQYPGTGRSPAADKQRYSLLLTELREAFELEATETGRERLLLTSTVSPNKGIINRAYEMDNVSREVDFLNLMTYDMHGVWDRETGHHSALFTRPELEGTAEEEKTQDWAANHWFEGGAPKEKIVIGMAMYGRCFQLNDSSDTGMGAPIRGQCPSGPYTGEAGFLSYYEVCKAVADGNATYVFDENHQVPYAYFEDSWIGYDDKTSLENKVNVLLMNETNPRGGYRGWMSWSLDLDDFTALPCDDGTFPLHTALNDAVNPNKKALF